jgi:HAD superfamily hydrolase (TIGR01484 family)
MIPLAKAPHKDIANLRAVLADIDDTLTLNGRLPAAAFKALEELRKAGLVVVPITGRPAGWCDHIARMWPVDAVVGENGAFTFRYDEKTHRMIRDYAQDAETRRANMARLRDIARKVLMRFPGAAIAADQAYREIDVAIDFCEDVEPLPLATAAKIKKMFEAEGAVAKISSIHVNAWFGDHDKQSMTRRLLRGTFKLDPTDAIYVGDSPNDAPMFARFPLSVGVANIAQYTALMDHLPRYVTEAEGGFGFAELAKVLIAARKGSLTKPTK